MAKEKTQSVAQRSGYSEKNIQLLLSLEGALAKIRNSPKKFYVYEIYGGTLGVVYVGKGTGSRIGVHERAARKFLNANPDLPYDDWISCGMRLLPKIERLATHLTYAPLRYRILCFTDSEERAFRIEKKLISRYGIAFDDSGCLSNKSSGRGPALHHDTELSTCEKISASLTGKTLSAEHRAKISKALTGRTVDPEAARRGGNTRRGMVPTEAHRKAVSVGRLASKLIPRVPVKVNGKRYRSIREASNATGIDYGKIVYSLNTGKPGYQRISNA